MLSILLPPPSFQPGTFPYKEDIMSTNNMCLVFAVLLFIGCILSFKVSLLCVHIPASSLIIRCFVLRFGADNWINAETKDIHLMYNDACTRTH